MQMYKKKIPLYSKNYIFLYKYTISITLTFLYMTAMIRPLMPLIVYYTNYDYIAEELCKNRDKPYLECNGVCFLNTMIEDLETQPKEEKSKLVVVLKMTDYPISTLDFFQYESQDYKNLGKLSPPILNTHFIPSEYSFSIFHPPKFSA